MSSPPRRHGSLADSLNHGRKRGYSNSDDEDAFDPPPSGQRAFPPRRRNSPSRRPRRDLSITDLTPKKPLKRKSSKLSKKEVVDSSDEETDGGGIDSPPPAKKARTGKGSLAKPTPKKAAKATTTFDTMGENYADAFRRSLEDLEEERDETEAKLRSQNKFVAKLRKHGVYVVNLMASAENAGRVAGYMNLHNKAQIGDIWTHIKATARTFAKLHKARYGMKQEGVMNPELVFKAIEDDMIKADDVISTADPDSARFPTEMEGDRSRQFLLTLRFIMKVKAELSTLDDIPEVFTGTPEGAPPKIYFEGTSVEICGEDIYRGIVFSSFLIAKYRANQKDTKIQAGKVILPMFETGAAPRINPGSIAAAGAASFQSLIQEGGLLRLGAADMIIAAMENDVSDEHAARNVDVRVSNKTFLSDRVGQISERARNEMVRSIAEQAEIMFEDKRRQDKTFFGKTGDATEVTDRLAEGASEDKDAAELVDRDLEAFLKLQASLNQNSAAAPSFEAARDGLRLVVTRDLPEKDKSTEDYFSIVYEEGVHLKTWQPQGIYWLVQMMCSMLGAGLLGDDGGLGKTIQVLCAIVEMSILTENDRKKWDEKFKAILQEAIDFCMEADPTFEPEGADEMGTIESADMLDEVVALGPKPTHRPVLVYVPPPALRGWLKTLNGTFASAKGTYHVVYRTLADMGGERASQKDKNLALKGEYEGILAWKRSLSPDDPQTSRTILLTTYQTWHRKVLVKDAKHERTQPDPEPEKPKSDDDDDDSDDEDDDTREADQDDPGDDDEAPIFGVKVKQKKETLKDLFRKKTVLRPGIADMFSIRVADEAHRLKDPDSKQSMAFNQLEDCKTALLTATAYKNRIEDFAGVLIPLFANVKKRLPANEPNEFNASAYQDMRKVFVERFHADFVNTPEDDQLKLARGLDPDRFLKLCSSQTSAEGSVSAGTTILPLPSSIIILRRVKGNIINLGFKVITLGAEIGTYTIIGMEGRQGAAERRYYRGVLETIKALPTDGSGAADDDLSGDSRQSLSAMLKRRRLILASCYPYLDHFAQRKVDHNAAKIHSKADKGWDSFSFLHDYTKADIHTCTPTGRTEMAQYICGASVKMAMFTLLLERHVIEQGEKVMIWCNEPINLFLVSILLDIYQIPFVSIHAGINNQARINAERDFNDDVGVRACVLSTRSASESMNMQKACHVQIMIDVVSTTQKIQCVCRSHRIGQTKDVILYCLTTDETYDQVLQALYSERFRVAVAAQTTIRPDHIQEMVANLNEDQRIEYSTKAAGSKGIQSVADLTMKPLRGPYADAVMRNLLGLRSNRHGPWRDAWNPCAKNELPVETVFRISYGGAVANEMGEQLRLRSLPKQGKEEDDAPEMRAGEDQRFRLITTTPFSLPQVAMTSAPRLPLEEGAQYILDAARELCRETAFEMNGFTEIAFLKAARSWFTKPKNFLERAIKLAQDASSPPLSDLDTDIDSHSDSVSEDESDDEARLEAIKAKRRGTGSKLRVGINTFGSSDAMAGIEYNLPDPGSEKTPKSPARVRGVSKTPSFGTGSQRNDDGQPTTDLTLPTSPVASQSPEAIADVKSEAVDADEEAEEELEAEGGADIPKSNAAVRKGIESDLMTGLDSLKDAATMRKYAKAQDLNVPSSLTTRASIRDRIIEQILESWDLGNLPDINLRKYEKKKGSRKS